ncbi:MAG: SpoIVB peptidase [Defluviitaleaceae bacterium]|nr:SpoIVB peptidase [Defluviitaleaceae bacterium]
MLQLKSKILKFKKINFWSSLIATSNILMLCTLIYYISLNNIFKEESIFASIEDTFLTPVGITVGIKVNTDGLMVLGIGDVIDGFGNNQTPAKNLQIGDHIIFANNIRLEKKEDLVDIVNEHEKIDLVIKRNENMITTTIIPIDDSLGDRKIGVWVRDMIQGIGTITYYNPFSGKFGALGHGIMDTNTKELMNIKDGKISLTEIESIKKGKKGSPGELVGYLNENKIIGEIKINTKHGIFGNLDESKINTSMTMMAAKTEEIQTGDAFIISNIEKEPKLYKVNIEAINKNVSDNSKGMVIKITDDELLEKTNGIVQGMSGSPIIQNNKIIGAITHVFVQDPTKGYGIFIENMLKQEISV